MRRIRFVLTLHNHQPVGNFDSVIEAAYHDSYRPFLDVIERYPEIPFCLHTSGSLIEWLVDHKPQYIDRLRRLVAQGRLEIIGGGFYEPILTMIPSRDRVGQIAGYSRYLEDLLDARIEGMWIPERVWEQSLVGDIVQAGIRYSILDDHHFKRAGLPPERLHGCFTTEDQGQVLKLFPGSETMRYLLPFRDVQEFLDQLGRIHQSQPDAVVVFADDGEKFGTWPETKKHVYENGWIYRFLDALRDNRHWIETCTLSQVTRDSQPIGHVYLPDSSYREMTEWALPADQLSRYERSTHDLEQVAAWHDVKQLVAAGQWRNFKAKYPETREMYARMLEVSQRLDTLVRSERQAFGDERVHQARTHLYRGQCNCPYWHGAFGGLYLPHLRGAVYQELIRADAALDAYEYALNPQPVVVESRDFNVDSFDEIKLANERVALYLAPAVGGHLYEIDVADVAVNLGASLSRRPEAYHDKIRHAPGDAPAHAVESIHDRVVCKTAGLDQQLQYDSYLRKSLIDHFLPRDSSLRSLAEGAGLELGDFVQTTYQANIESDPVRGAVELTRTGCVAGKSLRLRKRLSVEAADDTLQIHYELADLAIDQPVLFAIEWNMAALATGANDRYVVDARQQRLALLGESLEVHDACWIGLVDEWIGIEVGFGSSRPARFALSPIRSVSQSEAGFELVHQNMCVVLAWEILPQDRWSVDLTFSADTSLARSRRAHQSAGAPSF